MYEGRVEDADGVMVNSPNATVAQRLLMQQAPASVELLAMIVKLGEGADDNGQVYMTTDYERAREILVRSGWLKK